MKSATISTANAAYIKITGRSSPLKRMSRKVATHAWEDHQGKPFIALWAADRSLIGWRLDSVSHWLPGHEPTAAV